MATIGTNDTRKADYLSRCYDYGKAEGEGKNQRPEWGFDTFLIASQGLLVSDSKDKDKDDVWAAFSRYQTGVLKKFTWKGEADTNAKSMASQLSKARNLVVVGSASVFDAAKNPDVAENWVKLVKQCIGNLAKVSAKSVPVYDKFIAVLRVMKARLAKDKDAQPLTEDEIMTAIAQQPAATDELKTVRQLLGNIRKLSEKPGFEGSFEALEEAADALAPRVKELEAEKEENSLAENMAKYTPEQIARAVQAQGLKIAAE